MSLDMSVTLNCPFCQSNEAHPHFEITQDRWWINCNACLATGPVAFSETEAVELWQQAKSVGIIPKPEVRNG